MAKPTPQNSGNKPKQKKNSLKAAKDRFLKWLNGDFDSAIHIMETDETPYSNRQEIKESVAEIKNDLSNRDDVKRLIERERRSYYRLYSAVAIISAILLIGVITCVLSAIGVKIGNIFGSRFEKKAQMAGGIILILLGLKILLEHLGILG